MHKSWLAVLCDAAFAITATVFGLYLASDAFFLLRLPKAMVQLLLNASFLLVPASLVILALGAALLEPIRFRRYFKVSLAFNLIFGGIFLVVFYSGI